MNLQVGDKTTLAAPNRFESVGVADVFSGSIGWMEVPPIAVDDLKEPGYLREARGLVARMPDSVIAHTRLAQAELVAGRKGAALEKARSTAALILEQDLTDAATSVALARIFALAGQSAEAEDALRRVASEPAPALLLASLAMGRGDSAAGWRALEGLDSAPASLVRSSIALEAGDFQTSVREGRKALREGAPNVPVLVNMGLALAGLGQVDKGIAATHEAAALAPQSTRAVLNLAALLLRRGRGDEALRKLATLREADPADPDIRFAEAETLLDLGDFSGALQALKRARVDLAQKLDSVARAELYGNIELVRWRTGEMAVEEAAKRVIQEMEAIGFASSRMARLLPPLLPHHADAALFEKLLARLHEAHPSEPFHAERTHLAVLQRDFRTAIGLGFEWFRKAPFDPDAVLGLSFLLMEVDGAYEQAADLTLTAARRMPAAWRVCNNYAYAKACAGDPRPGERFLDRMPGADRLAEDPFLVATRSLARLLQGEEAALEGYETARRTAEAQGHSHVAASVALARLRVVQWLGLPVEDALEAARQCLPSDWRDWPTFSVLKTAFDREGLRWPG